MSELFTSGSVGGAAGNCCSYPAVRLMAQTAGQRRPQECAGAKDLFSFTTGHHAFITLEVGFAVKVE